MNIKRAAIHTPSFPTTYPRGDAEISPDAIRHLEENIVRISVARPGYFEAVFRMAAAVKLVDQFFRES